MKKTISALLMAALLPLSVADSLAASVGTINFTGTVAEGTCTVQDLNRTVQFRSLASDEVNNTAHGARLILNTIPMINITGCPASLSKAKVRLDYEPEGNPKYVKLAGGSASGIALYLSTGGDVPNPGHVRTLTLVNGAASGQIQGILTRNVSDADMGTPAVSVTEGTYSAVVNLSMSFE